MQELKLFGGKLDVTFDYDWKDADSSSAGAIIRVKAETDDKARELLLNGDDQMHELFANSWTSLVPKTVNGVRVRNPGERNECWITVACIAHLNDHPGTHEFKIEGSME